MVVFLSSSFEPSPPIATSTTSNPLCSALAIAVRLAGVYFALQTKSSDDRAQYLEKSPPRRGGTYTNGERRFSISR
jgi:hypothetical protein